MAYFVLFQVVLLSFAMVNAVPVSNTAIEIRNIFHNIVEAGKISPRAEMETIVAAENDNDTAGEADQAVKFFLETAMLNYSNWLGDGNNTEPDPADIVLNTTGLPSGQPINLKANLQLRTNQYNANHSTADFIFPLVTSKVAEDFVSVMRVKLIDDNDLLVTFGGDYNVTGSFNVNSSLEIRFSGEGQWELKGKYEGEYITYNNYSVDSNGYVDLSNASISFAYSISWEQVEFQNLKFDYQEEADDSWLPTVKKELAGLYGKYLANNLTPDKFQEHNQPRRLLHKYLQETLKSKKLDDILSKCTSEPCHGCNLLASSWVIVVTLAAYYYNV